MLPKPVYFNEMSPLGEVVRWDKWAGMPPGPLDLDKDGLGDWLPKAWRRLVGKDLPMQPHVAVYHNGQSAKPHQGAPDGGKQPHVVIYTPNTGDIQFVLRCADGWRVIGWNLGTYEKVADPAVLARRLAGLELRAGTPAANLAPIVFSEPPSFDRRWLPPLPVILEHLPAYRLRLQPTADGFALREEGVPLAGLFLTSMTMMSPDPSLLARLRGEAVLRRDGPALRQRHARAIAALRRTAEALRSRNPEDSTLMSPSALLAAAGTDPAELASLCGGAAPGAAQLDRLGFFHPSRWPAQHFGWLIPLDDGLFLECHWARPEGCDVVATPHTPQRQPSAEELARVRSKGGGGAALPAPMAPPPVSDF
jgi:hypothetical protein